MTPEARLKTIQLHIARMPSLSTTVAKVLEVCNNPFASPQELNRVISLDPVLAGQVLKLINSAYYSLPNRIGSLTRAIIMLGVNTVKNLVLATSVLAAFKGSKANALFAIDDFWAHSLCVGAATKEIARLDGVPPMEQEEYFVAGLLHDLGKLPMAACFADAYSRAMRRCREQEVPLFKAERQEVGFDHCQVGWLIGAKWKLNAAMQHAVVHHHQPLAEGCRPDRLLLFVSLANQMAHQFRIATAGDDYQDRLLIQELVERIGTDVATVAAMEPRVLAEVEKAKVFLKQSRKG
ncbi:HDOD domain-containing protein [Desulfatitalea alkaliphila]|uniref:HDOD domain-containing protein n=1 Tax=Desulfatitalea alkaliphila TaxID=2929485 RepID=A0AA41R188_9BACT|nr:HDOD domain-containing protein [Desulfatitalea alkaliphila]MCJ8501017.1 HDOD domain-containing protein [Desulfatitalea alkaliphila]